MLSLDDFDYHLPEKLIAQEPVTPKDSARLLVVDRQKRTFTDHYVYELKTLLPPHTHIVVNNTKVFPARLLGHKITGGKVELLLTAPLGNSQYLCLTRPGLKPGDTVIIDDDFTGTIIKIDEGGIERIIKWNVEEATLREAISKYGQMPTPPYVKKMIKDPSLYQTIYAKYGFSAAAPTAGLHFTKSLQQKLKKDFYWHELTLNVGLGTFLPVKENNITKHHMHQEKFTINQHTADRLNLAKGNGEKILAVGTTTLRALESSITKNGNIIAQSKNTDIFIYPPYTCRSSDFLMTNFHLPKSTLLMLISAFTTNKNKKFTTFQQSLIGQAYQHAIDKKYRFFSFGDAMLIL